MENWEEWSNGCWKALLIKGINYILIYILKSERIMKVTPTNILLSERIIFGTLVWFNITSLQHPLTRQ